jgi:cation diffusion facilitator family transporter
VTPQRRTALISVAIVFGLFVLKLVVGLATHSLGIVSEGLHSGTDLVAALLTFFALGWAGRPADPGHQYGHGKAEHLAALGEAFILVIASLFIALRAGEHLAGRTGVRVHATWYAYAVIAGAMAVDVVRTTISFQTARRFRSPALASNALHFASDFAGSTAVLVGLVLVSAGFRRADAAAALFVAALVLSAAARLMLRNVDVLMDRAPADAHDAARTAIEGIRPAIDLRRLRLRQAAGRHFADVVIGVSPEAAVAQGHAAADAVEAAVRRALPGADIVVHVEPRGSEAQIRERAHAAALGVRRVREIHNVSVLNVEGSTEISLHLKLPGDLALEEAHALASEVERAIVETVPEVDSVQTHLEPLGVEAEGREAEAAEEAEALVARVVEELTGRPPRELRLLQTDEGLVAFLTLGLDPSSTLAEAHARASAIEERIRRERPEITDVHVHTEP